VFVFSLPAVCDDAPRSRRCGNSLTRQAAPRRPSHAKNACTASRYAASCQMMAVTGVLKNRQPRPGDARGVVRRGLGRGFVGAAAGEQRRYRNAAKFGCAVVIGQCAGQGEFAWPPHVRVAGRPHLRDGPVEAFGPRVKAADVPGVERAESRLISRGGIVAGRLAGGHGVEDAGIKAMARKEAPRPARFGQSRQGVAHRQHCPASRGAGHGHGRLEGGEAKNPQGKCGSQRHDRGHGHGQRSGEKKTNCLVVHSVVGKKCLGLARPVKARGAGLTGVDFLVANEAGSQEAPP